MFGKVFASMYDGTLATRGPWQALVTFQQFIVLADRTGIVDMTPDAIARRTTIPIEIIKVGIAALEQQDSESRSPDLDGRRIARLSDSRDWGWQIVNYDKYRKIRSEDERREYMANLMRERRRKEKAQSVDSKHPLAKLAHADVDVEVVTQHPRKNTKPNGAETWQAYAEAYHQRYDADPVRNAKANAQISQFCSRVSATEAPSIAAFYVRHNNARYVSAGHALGFLLMDAEKLRTEWATGRQVTQTQAMQADKRQAVHGAFAKLIEDSERDRKP